MHQEIMPGELDVAAIIVQSRESSIMSGMR